MSDHGQVGVVPQKRTSTIAIVAIILAIVVPIAGIVVGIIARREVARTGEEGRGLSTAAIIVGIVLSILTVLPLLLVLPDLIQVYG
ncbi:DUF4190 domain-containing protein [Curtobacterium sp. SP.BCp]|uniref:DUF4190 domain-containing protein n=1 Tax=Curtobacterium sp. SP.BCp TaxID=3435230 RepID=UPI003F740105